MFQGEAEKKNTGEKLADQPQCFNVTCIDMLSVGVGAHDSMSVHTLMSIAGSVDICLTHPNTAIILHKNSHILNMSICLACWRCAVNIQV